MPLDPAKIRAVLFDVFGTCVDWRSTVTTALQAQARTTLNDPTASLATAVRLRATDLTPADWARFAQEWRDEYKKFTRGMAAAALTAKEETTTTPPPTEFKTVDQHHLDSLKTLLAAWHLDGLWTEQQVERLSLAWHFLAPWPDAAGGIAGLNALKAAAGPSSSAKKHGEEKTYVTTATLSNANAALLADLAAHARLPFTRVLGADEWRAYKPHPAAYRGAVERLGARPEECVLVAAHLADLRAARACGLQTVYVERSGEEEWGADEVGRAREEGWVGLWVGEGEGGFGRVVEVLAAAAGR